MEDESAFQKLVEEAKRGHGGEQELGRGVRRTGTQVAVCLNWCIRWDKFISLNLKEL